MVSRKGLAKKLQNFGVEAKEGEVVCVSLAIAQYIRNRRGKVLVFGEGLKEDLKKAGIKLTDKPDADYLIVGYDHKFNHEKLCMACEAIKNGAKFLTPAIGKRFIYNNSIIPGTGVFVEAVERASGKKALLLGKPSDYMLQTINLFVQSPMKQTVLFGDELNSDVLLGKKAGWFTVLVRTGVDKKASKSIKPDAIIDSIADIKI
jgi:HAD superfamily hydrolase (TIGR01450 family)